MPKKPFQKINPKISQRNQELLYQNMKTLNQKLGFNNYFSKVFKKYDSFLKQNQKREKKYENKIKYIFDLIEQANQAYAQKNMNYEMFKRILYKNKSRLETLMQINDLKDFKKALDKFFTNSN